MRRVVEIGVGLMVATAMVMSLVGVTFSIVLMVMAMASSQSPKRNVAIMSRMLGAIETLASLTTSPRRQHVLSEHTRWSAELAECFLESAHDLATIDKRLAQVSSFPHGFD